MAVIDYHGVRSGAYAKLTLSAKALIPVLATLADNVTGTLTSKESKINNLKELTGISRNAVRSALKNLAKSKQISVEGSQGHPAQITYLPILNFTQNQEAGYPLSGQLANLSEDSQLFKKNAIDPRHDLPKPERQIPCSLNTVLNTKTTTGPVLQKSLIKDMIAKHGSDVVVPIVFGMNDILEADPQAIKNPGGYFRACCEQNWVPTSKTIQEKKLIMESRERARAAQDAADAKEEKRRQQIRKEQNDPEAQKRIQAVQLSFMEMSTPSHSDNTAMSGHARLQKHNSGQH